MWILMENQNYSSIYPTGAPYMANLANQCGLATNYHAISHPSLPNYIALTTGSTQGITDDGGPGSHPLNVENIYHQNYPSAKGYAESMNSNCQLADSGSGSTHYIARHAPWIYFVNGTVGPQRDQCNLNDIPMGTAASGNFHNDVAAGTLPNFSFVTPNGCNDMHDCSVATGNTYLQNLVPTIIAGPDYQAGRLLIVIVFDENAGASGNQVFASLVSKTVAPGTVLGTNFTHYSLLRTTEEILGKPLLGNAGSAASMLPFLG
jgi:phosphatidylinositol-3-phosphatase